MIEQDKLHNRALPWKIDSGVQNQKIVWLKVDEILIFSTDPYRHPARLSAFNCTFYDLIRIPGIFQRGSVKNSYSADKSSVSEKLIFQAE